MAEPMVSFLVECIGKLFMEEGKLLTGVSNEADRLQSELKIIRAICRKMPMKGNMRMQVHS
ncbi:OLC1v1019646C1 [Oldenlandia corymbosa var. corymbosa]|uniref:OLC1v1019646C1 n=1 Tax=Oldenlandia corymbosa var. corymbosa TaxID=529605 RepID=A0AAV1EEJ8_OLDCO|nr:OLC1v1019646C1 [Oldenlandia corymbosa var. corymbosa]